MANNLPSVTTENTQQTKAALIVGGMFAVAMFLILAVFGILAIGDNNISVRDVQVTNVTDTAFTLTWVSESPYAGSVVYKEGSSWPALFAQSGAKVSFDDRDVELDKDGNYVTVEAGAKERFTHHVTVRNLKPETEYSFRVGGRINGKGAEITTAKTRKLIEDIKTPDPGYGKVEGVENTDSFIVFGVSSRADQGLWSTTISAEGTYSLDVNPLSKEGKFDAREAIANVRSKSDDVLVARFNQPLYKPFETVINSAELNKSEPLGSTLGKISASTSQTKQVRTIARVNVRSYDSNTDAITTPKVSNSVLRVEDLSVELTVDANKLDLNELGEQYWYKLSGENAVVAASLVEDLPPNTSANPPRQPTPIPASTPPASVSNCPDAGQSVVNEETEKRNIRAGTGTNYSIVGTLVNDGTSLEILDCQVVDGYTWYKVEHDSPEAFVRSDVVKLVPTTTEEDNADTRNGTEKIVKNTKSAQEPSENTNNLTQKLNSLNNCDSSFNDLRSPDIVDFFIKDNVIKQYSSVSVTNGVEISEQEFYNKLGADTSKHCKVYQTRELYFNGFPAPYHLVYNIVNGADEITAYHNISNALFNSNILPCTVGNNANNTVADENEALTADLILNREGYYNGQAFSREYTDRSPYSLTDYENPIQKLNELIGYKLEPGVLTNTRNRITGSVNPYNSSIGYYCSKTYQGSLSLGGSSVPGRHYLVYKQSTPSTDVAVGSFDTPLIWWKAYPTVEPGKTRVTTGSCQQWTIKHRDIPSDTSIYQLISGAGENNNQRKWNEYRKRDNGDQTYWEGPNGENVDLFYVTVRDAVPDSLTAGLGIVYFSNEEYCKNTTIYDGNAGAPPGYFSVVYDDNRCLFPFETIPTNDVSRFNGRCRRLVGDVADLVTDKSQSQTLLVPGALGGSGIYKIVIEYTPGSLDECTKKWDVDCRQITPSAYLNKQSSPIIPSISAATPAAKDAYQPRVLGAGSDQSLELTESGRYAFFRDGERIAEQDVVVQDGEIQVRLFNDLNGNGIKDAGEEYFTDYSQISIAKEASAEEFNLTSGWNLIHLPLIDTRTDGNVDSAAELIDYWNGQGADIKHVARYRNGQFQMFSKRESGTEYSTDFDLIPGEGLFILNLAGNTNVTFSGNRFESSVPVKLNQGWNLVGIIAPGQTIKSEDVLKKAQTQGFSADTISQFEGGTYQSVISKNDTIFGNNFNIVDKKGYLIRVESGGGQSFDPGK